MYCDRFIDGLLTTLFLMSCVAAVLCLTICDCCVVIAVLSHRV